MSERLRVYVGSTTGVEVWNVAGAGWARQTGFLKGDARALAGRRDRQGTVFASVHHDGLYRTEDAGARWERVFDGDVRSVTVDPHQQQVVYVGTEPVHLYRSEDGGASWSEVDGLQHMPEEVKKRWWFPQPPHDGHVLKVWVHPDDSRILYLCLEHGGVVRSLNHGETWEDVSAGIAYLDIHHIASNPGRPDTFFLSTARGFFRTDNPAEGWSPADTGMPWAHSAERNYSHDFAVLPPRAPGGDVTLVLAGANGSPGFWDRPSHAEGVILRSDDGANSWHELTRGLPAAPPRMAWSIVPHPEDADTLLAGFGEHPSGTGEMYVTQDRGDSWQRVNASFPAIRSMWVEVD